MGERLRILHLEDNDEDALLVRRMLEKEGLALDVVRADSSAAFERALREGPYDLILSDFTLPGYDGLSALRRAREALPAVPFIFVSGTMGEETAVEGLLAGAADYVLKHRMARLGQAVARVLREARLREERQRAEERLRSSEARFRRILESNVVGLFVADAAEQVVEANDVFLALVGRSRGDLPFPLEALGSPDAAVVGEEAREELDRRGSYGPAERALRATDGRAVPVLQALLRVDPVRGSTLGFVLDLRKQKELEEGLRQAQRLEGVGRLAGGVAHDFNNLLTVILGCAGMAFDKLADGHPARADLDEIRRAGERAAGLTRQLLALSRRQTLRPRRLDLNAVVRDMSSMLRRVVGDPVRLELRLADGLPSVRADPGQIEQVVLNLVLNARDAMPRGGRAAIETLEGLLAPDYARAHPSTPPTRFVLLRVSDEGTGIPAEVRAHLFEPFYTTKEGRGTGLGLASVHGIVTQSGGHVWAETLPGGGTTFTVALPPVSGPAETSEAVPSVLLPSSGPEHVLVVEDNDAVRLLTCEVLRTRGYAVLEADGPESALRVAEDPSRRIDLLLTDILMPGGRGTDLAAQIAARRPGLKVLYMSGFTDLEDMVADAFLQKPFNPPALLDAVRRVLDGRV